MAVAISTSVVRLVNEVPSEREVTVRNDGPDAVSLSKDPLLVAAGTTAFVVALNASQDVTLSPGESLFARCATGKSASVEVL